VTRRRSILFVLLAFVGVSAACAQEKTGTKEVRAALNETRLEPHRFAYTVNSPDAAYQVQGLVEDDFRYKARLIRDSEPVFDEVVNDDAIAVRFAQPDLLGPFVDDSQREVADLDTDLTGVSVIDVLEAKRWVLDPNGAPSLTDSSRTLRNQGKDPVFDALGVFDYVEQAMAEAFEVKKWSADDLNPAYRVSEDVFPRPSDGSGVVRYDLRRPFLPPIGTVSGSSSDSFLATKHFRKMAIYVKDGKILRVMERVEVTGKAAEDFVGYVKQVLKAIGLPKEEIDAFDDSLDGLNDKERSDTLLAAVNQGLEASGQPLIAVRTMTIDIEDIGDDDIEATLPTDTIEGSLGILVNRGQKTEAATASGSPTAPAASQSSTQSSTTSTTAPSDED
jgi:hypothetical protein